MLTHPESILITGVSGFLGSEVALAFLRKGHQIRATVRKDEQVKAWSDKYPEWKDAIEWFVVPDIAAPGALDRAVEGATRVVHTASPFRFDINDPSELLEPAIQGTEEMLKSAVRTSSVRTVVITSSIAAVLDRSKGFRHGYHYTSQDWNPCSLEDAKTETSPILLYIASKTLAERAAWDFMKSAPHFTLTTLCPSVILGPAPQPLSSLKSLNQSSKVIWGLVDAPAVPPTFAPTFIDVRDCALAHYEATFRPAAIGKRYLLIGGTFSNVAIADILRESFPSQASRIPTGGTTPGEHYTWDHASVEKDLGIIFTSLEDSVKDAGVQLFAAEKDGAGA